MNEFKLRNALGSSLCVLMLTSVGCGGDGRSDGSGDGVSTMGETTADSNDTNEANEAEAEANEAEANEAEAEAEAGTETATETGDGDGDQTDTNNDGDEGPKFDLGGIPDNGPGFCGNGGGNDDPEYSFLWASNSSQGTITKIDTKTVTEVGRFMTRPDFNGSPSRTSVSLSGHVAVANRNGGVTKIYATEDLCQESNGMPGIQTSTNNQYLAWDVEECRAWHTPMNYVSQRPVAWAPGEFNAGTCQWEEEHLWTSGNNQGATIDIMLLDGEDGTIIDMVAVPADNTNNGLNQDYFGIYGGASDADGNFWGSQLGSGKIIRVNKEDMSYDIYPAGPQGGWYGMTVDNEGMVWLCSYEVGRFDPSTETWSQAQVGGYTGCMADAGENGLLWMSDGSGVVGVDRDTLQVVKTCAGPGSYGISIDFEGYVWAVASGSTATKFDPETCQTWSYNGLVGAYTYSDMTGYALTNAGSAQQ
jgi:streptogramin lyase